MRNINSCSIIGLLRIGRKFFYESSKWTDSRQILFTSSTNVIVMTTVSTIFVFNYWHLKYMCIKEG